MLHTTLGKVILTGILVIAGGGFLIYSSLEDAQYYEMVDKVAAKPGDYLGKDLKLHGYVLAGSIDDHIEGDVKEQFFILQKDGAEIRVHHLGPKPDNLKPRSEVVAQGRLFDKGNGDLQFEATELMAKCPSKYQGAQSQKEIF
jgi:cytochrome c-type biogenesis protein CcmE